MKNHKLPREYSAIHVEYTKDDSPNRTYNPPKEYIKGKIRDLEVWWGRLNHSPDGQDCVIDVYSRHSSTGFSDDCIGYTSLTSKELGNVIPRFGDAFWIWTWVEERIGKGLVARVHIEVESKILTEEERRRCGELAEELRKELQNKTQETT